MILSWGRAWPREMLLCEAPSCEKQLGCWQGMAPRLPATAAKGPGMLFVSVKLLLIKAHRATLEEANKINKTANSCFAFLTDDLSIK